MSDDFKPVHELTARQGRSIEILVQMCWVSRWSTGNCAARRELKNYSSSQG